MWGLSLSRGTEEETETELRDVTPSSPAGGGRAGVGAQCGISGSCSGWSLLGLSHVGRRWWGQGWVNLEPSPRSCPATQAPPCGHPHIGDNTCGGFQVRTQAWPPGSRNHCQTGLFHPALPTHRPQDPTALSSRLRRARQLGGHQVKKWQGHRLSTTLPTCPATQSPLPHQQLSLQEGQF